MKTWIRCLMKSKQRNNILQLRKEYREKKTAGLRAAIEARNEADAMIREEMKGLGYQSCLSRGVMR